MQLSNVLSNETWFYTCILPFVAFFGAFAFVMYPLRDALHQTEFSQKLLELAGPRFSGPIAILRNWTFCLFYVMAELWGSVVVSVLFWGFANQVITSTLCAPLTGWVSRSRAWKKPRSSILSSDWVPTWL